MFSLADEPVYREAAAAVRAAAAALLFLPGYLLFDIIRYGFQGWWPDRFDLTLLLVASAPAVTLLLTIRPVRRGRVWAVRVAATILSLVGGVLMLMLLGLLQATVREVRLNDTTTRINLPHDGALLVAVAALLIACALCLRHLWHANDADGVLNGSRGFAVEPSPSADPDKATAAPA